MLKLYRKIRRRLQKPNMTLIYINPLGCWSTCPNKFEIQTTLYVHTNYLNNQYFIYEMAAGVANRIFEEFWIWRNEPSFFANKNLTSNVGGAF